MKNGDRVKNFVVFGAIAILAACSTSTVSAPENESSSSSSVKSVLEESSSSNKNSSEAESSSSSSKKVSENCNGTPGIAWDGTTAKSFACGNGTASNPYIVLTAEQLAYLSFVTNASESEYAGKFFKLGADILLSDSDILNKKGELTADSGKLVKWTPIGNSDVKFTGNFDGDGYTVSGIFINTTSSHNGLFGNSSGTVQNVTVSDSWIQGGKQTAGIVGYNTGTIQNVSNKATVIGTENVGGIVGASSYKGSFTASKIKRVLNSGNISGSKQVGGIVGSASYVEIDSAQNTAQINGSGLVGGIAGKINNQEENFVCALKNSGKISGTHFTGGILGACGGSTSVYSNGSSSGNCMWLYLDCGKIQNAINEADVEGASYTAGITGFVCEGTVTGAGNTGKISGENYSGGVFGKTISSTTKNLFNRETVTGKIYVGGIAGYNEEGVTSSAYTTAKVDGDSLVGNMIGYNYNATMADYYYLSSNGQEPFGANNGGGSATAKTETEMTSEKFLELLGEGWTLENSQDGGFPNLSGN